MVHKTKDKKKLLVRVKRIQGQFEGFMRTLGEVYECSAVLQAVAACRGTLNGLMAELIEGHIRFHVLSPNGRKNAAQTEAAQ